MGAQRHLVKMDAARITITPCTPFESSTPMWDLKAYEKVPLNYLAATMFVSGLQLYHLCGSDNA